MNKLRYIFIVSGLFFSITANAAESGNWQSPEFVEGAETISLQQAKKLHAEGVKFVDVRSDRQFAKRHIPGAIHLYINTEFTEANLLKHFQRDTPFVIYCNGAHCSLSYKTAIKAVAWGFTGIKYYRDGFRAWRLDGNPLEYGIQ